MKYLVNAPTYLRNMHEGGKEGQAKKLLGLLLSDLRMAIVWARLGRQIKTDIEWLRLWQGIKSAINDANPKRKPKRVEYEAADLRWIATRAAELAKVIRIERRGTRDYRGFFDLQCHQFCPDDVMGFNGIPTWSSLDSMAQYAAAFDVMKTWPTMGELLDGLSARALERADEIKTKRVVLKDKGRWPETMFSRHLYSHLSQYHWGKLDCVFANIATIANMAIETKYLKPQASETVSAKFVGNTIRGTA